MHREGHVGAALVAYAPLGALTMGVGFDELAILGAFGAVGLAMAPDIDMRIPGVRHRGITHTVWFALAVGGVCAILGAYIGASQGILALLGLAIWGFLIGALTIGAHLLADALTPAGVRPFIPYRAREYSLAVARASNPIANYVLLALGVGAVAGGLWLGNTVATL